jgi:uncharacterized hydrophobic protein (TIGR00271 family)
MPADVLRMRDQLFVEGEAGHRKRSRFWLLLLLSAVIATAGVIGDSTATVIGAMIVAPLMTPILGIVLAIVLSDRVNLFRSIALVVGGAAAVILIAWAMGHLVALEVVAQTNTQVSVRVHPRLIDLLAALATGAVGAVALARSDISDTLPGVAIAISLVPPLAVVGLTLESGATDEALGALLLFGTNVAAILLSGVVVMAIYRVALHATGAAAPTERRRRRSAVALVTLSVIAVAVPLAVTSQIIGAKAVGEQTLTDVASVWAEEAGWRLVDVESVANGYRVRAAGPLPEPDTASLRDRLDDAGLGDERIQVELAPERLVVFDGDG